MARYRSSAPANAIRHYYPRHVGYDNTCGPARHGNDDCRDVSCGGVCPVARGRTDEGRAVRRRGRGVDHVRRRRGARDAHSGVVPDASRFRPGGLGLPARHFPLRRVEQRWRQLRRLGRRTTGRPARHHGLPCRRRRCTTPARPQARCANVPSTSLAMDPDDICSWRTTIRAGVRPRDQR